MAVYRVLNELVVPEADFYREGAQIMRSQAPQSGLEESVGGGTITDFVPVGKGQPLTVMLRHVYTGRYPKQGFFSGNDSDVAVVSGVKDFGAFAASARALNLIAQNQGPKSHLQGSSAFSQGSSVITYTPAVLTDSVTVSVEMAVATFPADFVKAISSAFGALAGMPIVLPYAGYLLGAGQIIKIAGELGHSLLDGPVFSFTDSLNFEIPGSEKPSADFRILAANAFPAERYRFSDRQGLIDKVSNSPYDGDEPYVVISLDGRENTGLRDFAPTVASASILQRFFEIKNGQQAGIDAVVEGVQLLSDLKLHERGQQLASDLKAEPEGSDKHKKIEAELDALKKNIKRPELQFKS